MKTCPVCQAVAFDDAEICFGCMHRFEEGDGALPDAGANVDAGPDASVEAVLPVFSIRFTPEVEATGAVKWSCAVETT